jgi:RTA1 like protein
MILGRIIRLTDGESHSLIKTKWLTKLFVLGDVLSILAQSGGMYYRLQARPRDRKTCANILQGGTMLAKAKDPDAVKLGEHIISGGLFIQVVFFGFFVIVAGVFHYWISLHPTTRSRSMEFR